MKRIIYAEDVKEQIDEWLDSVGTALIGKHLSYYGELLGCIEDAPTVESVPAVYGEWIANYDLEDFTNATCSTCGEISQYMYKFCPNCGANMRKKEKQKRTIDANAWINKLNKIINDPEAPGELIDYCHHMINEIESEIHAQEKENE